ncbi:MAG: hypothetical protein GY768_09510 [Planctomycetaceae bacterium]|nr:hypothetical protein [Planctomycetaceae bacterium]
MGKRHKQPTPSNSPSSPRRKNVLSWLFFFSLPLLAASYLAADWWVGLPEDSTPNYVGRNKCATCHATEMKQWEGSDHDLAMDLATPETVLGDFDNAEIEHYGIVSRMYRDGDRYMVHTEGPDGSMMDFQVKYVFGVRPLQQYMVEFDRPQEMPEHEVSRLQVLRISWDCDQQEWFYLSPPDVKEKLSPDDPLHWTNAAQNWNHMCAECHSTNLKKNYDVPSRTYHTTFSEIDVSCEACHGPGSLHVQLAEAKSPFWDRKLGYGLKKLKGTDSKAQIETCAPCHSRRRVVHSNQGFDDYYDCFHNELIRPNVYHADGQILDEVYVYGSFIQSKMYHKGIRCTDCHDPHTTRLKAEGNQLCVSCHTHTPAKYDTSGHHFHPVGSTGAQCVECHMPETPYMDIDLRRDHSLRVPRPDLSVELNTPNACTGCHLDPKRIAPEKREQLQHYSQWLTAAREGDEEVAAEIDRVNRWSAEWFEKWWGKKDRPHYAAGIAASWEDQPDAVSQLLEVAKTRDYPAIARASALLELQRYNNQEAIQVAYRALRNKDPQLRAAAILYLETQPPRELIKRLTPLLQDPVRLIRTEAARVLAGVPISQLTNEDQRAFQVALDEYREGLQLNSDQAGAQMALGILSERMNRPQEAIRYYRDAIHVQPDVSGPRSNLASLLEQMGDREGATKLRLEELDLLRRDTEMAPNLASVHYRYGLSLYLNGKLNEAAIELKQACELDAENFEFRMALTLLYERLRQWDQAMNSLGVLRELQPENPSLNELEMRFRLQARQSNTTP